MHRQDLSASAHLHSVVLLIAHVNEAECIGCYAPRIIEFAICGALRTKGAQESSLRIEHLYAMIVSANGRQRRVHGETGCHQGFAISYLRFLFSNRRYSTILRYFWRYISLVLRIK